jgi:hypothetical protein
LFTDKGLFSSFSEKIWAAYFLQFIGPRARRDMDLIRLIRNEVAHNMNPVSFSTPEIASRCLAIDIAKGSIPAMAQPPDLRGIFLVSVQLYTGALLLKAIEPMLDAGEIDMIKILGD